MKYIKNIIDQNIQELKSTKILCDGHDSSFSYEMSLVLSDELKPSDFVYKVSGDDLVVLKKSRSFKIKLSMMIWDKRLFKLFDYIMLNNKEKGMLVLGKLVDSIAIKGYKDWSSFLKKYQTEVDEIILKYLIDYNKNIKFIIEFLDNYELKKVRDYIKNNIDYIDFKRVNKTDKEKILVSLI